MQKERDKMEVRYISTFQLAAVTGLLILNTGQCWSYAHSPPLCQGSPAHHPRSIGVDENMDFRVHLFSICHVHYRTTSSASNVTCHQAPWRHMKSPPEHTQPGMFLQKQDPWQPTLILQLPEPKGFCCLSNLAHGSKEKLPKNSRPALMLKTWQRWPWLIVGSVRGW